MTDEEYLIWSIKSLQETHDHALEVSKVLQQEIEVLREDMKVIKSTDLKRACKSVHNTMTVQKRKALNKVKDSLVDLKHCKSIIRTLKKK